MTLDNEGTLPPLQGYVTRCQEYLGNAFTSLEQNEVEKAGEFLWGSMAQAIKAVASLKGVELRNHGAIWTYVRELTKELGDEDLLEAFRDANSLHQNFYESGLTSDIVLTHGERIRYAVGKMLGMIPPGALSQ
jgi:hypothetical protein